MEPETTRPVAVAPTLDSLDLRPETADPVTIIHLDDDTAAILVSAGKTAAAGEIAQRITWVLSNLPTTRELPVAVIPVPNGKLAQVPEQAMHQVGYMRRTEHERLLEEALEGRAPACPITGQDLEGLNAYELEVEDIGGNKHTLRTAVLVQQVNWRITDELPTDG